MARRCGSATPVSAPGGAALCALALMSLLGAVLAADLEIVLPPALGCAAAALGALARACGAQANVPASTNPTAMHAIRAVIATTRRHPTNLAERWHKSNLAIAGRRFLTYITRM